MRVIDALGVDNNVRVYDRFIDEYIDEEDMDPIAPPERYVQITEDTLIENATRWLADALKKFNDVEDDPDIEYIIKKKGEPMTEIYRLRLDHYIDDGENRHQLEEPLVVSMAFDTTFMPAAVCLNSMLDKMREEILSRGKEPE